MAFKNANYWDWTPEDWEASNQFVTANNTTPEGQRTIYDAARAAGFSSDSLAPVLSRATGESYTGQQVNDFLSSQGWSPLGGTATPTYQPPTGLVSSVMNYSPQTVQATGYTPQTATASGYSATKAPDAVGYNVGGYDAATGEAATIEGQESVSEALNRIIDEDSPYMRAAATSADQQMNRRGLLNSSMAVGAAQDAAVRTALPIAQGDVQTSLNVNLANQGAKNQMTALNVQSVNQARSFLALAQNTANQFKAAEQNQNGRFNAQQANEAARFAANAQNVASMFNAEQANIAARYAAEAANAAAELNATAYNRAMDSYTAAMNNALGMEFQAQTTAAAAAAKATADRDLATLEGEYRNLIQTNASATSLFNSLQDNITRVLSNTEYDEASKQSMVNTLVQTTQNAMSVLAGTSGLDLGSLLNFGTA